VDLFPKATVLIQRAEYDWAFSSATKPFSASHPVEKLEGEKDVFGDGSVRIIPTPGTPRAMNLCWFTCPRRDGCS
jgi:N-acyl homoserine lactone hydrolase